MHMYMCADRDPAAEMQPRDQHQATGEWTPSLSLEGSYDVTGVDCACGRARVDTARRLSRLPFVHRACAQLMAQLLCLVRMLVRLRAPMASCMPHGSHRIHGPIAVRRVHVC